MSYSSELLHLNDFFRGAVHLGCGQTLQLFIPIWKHISVVSLVLASFYFCAAMICVPLCVCVLGDV